ncbi:hypothetical protein BU16DRAFT_617785 [Lophium mytilinum]|uniref:Uncharacterized protein n=1 Tax=Lophium mytilinum TaxID=390894 RepID=A0A6A6QVV9_9PEZI|nr:hypothetical protein BU16DRAFT_617785 [Lophium mytilinum]
MSTQLESQFITAACNEPPTEPTKPSKFLLQEWWLEIGAVFLSLGSFCAMSGILLRQDKQPLSNWTFPTSLNTVVSILGTISRTTLAFATAACLGQQKWNWFHGRSNRLSAFERFDDATRGPWGGTLLFIALRMKHWAALGAFASVIFITFDPFLQAVITTYGDLNVSSVSSIPQLGRTSRLDLGWITGDQGCMLDGPRDITMVNNDTEYFFYTADIFQLYSWTITPDLGLNSALFGALSKSGLSGSSLAASCETGNCTWPTYTSLAICSACSDVSAHINSSRTYINDSFSDSTPPYWSVEYHLDAVQLINNESALFNASGDIVFGLNATANPAETISFRNSSALIVAFTTMKSPDSYLNGTTKWSESKPVASECALSFCVNEYTTTMVNNTVHEKVNNSYSARNHDSYGHLQDPENLCQMINVQNGYGLGAETNTNMSSSTNNLTAYCSQSFEYWKSFTGNSLWMKIGSLFNYSEPLNQWDLQLLGPEGDGGSTTKFNISVVTIISTIQYILDWSLGSQSTKSISEEMGGTCEFSPNPLVMGTMKNVSGGSQSQMMSVLFQTSNITSTFENISLSMSNYIRNIDQAEMVNGTTLQWVTHFKIQWAYLTAPITALVAGCVYVGLAIGQTRNLRLPAWKESIVPTLVYGLSKDDQEFLRDSGTKDLIGRARKTVKLRFDDDDGGVRKLKVV